MERLKLYVNPSPMIFLLSFTQTINGPAYISFAFISLKFFKDWQKKQQDIFNLQKENANAELQLLKAQIHPHFLFNTLNNIYSFTLNKSQYAKHLVKELEGILRYMIEDCNQSFVPLAKEIKMINDYLELEKVRYGNKLNIQTEIKDGHKNKMVTPLLMIPFIENSFKHGASKMLKEPWIKLFIQADDDVLHFSLTNSKPAGEVINGKGGIGLTNVKKRLELLYPQNHLLLIETTANTFTVNMQVPLQRISEADQYTTEKAIII